MLNIFLNKKYNFVFVVKYKESLVIYNIVCGYCRKLYNLYIKLL